MKTLDNFAVFIQTYRRADRVVTYENLRKSGYTGRIIILIDDTDDQADEYKKRYKNQVIVFSKKAMAETFDKFDNFGRLDSITCARNACFHVARELGIEYFVEMDDDYIAFQYRRQEGDILKSYVIQSLDAVFSAFIEFMKSTPTMSIAFAQGGDYIGGCASSSWKQKNNLPRKCMNTFFCKTDRPITFLGIMNEDVNTYTALGRVGKVFLTCKKVCIVQKATQSNTGGITELYLDKGTYVKSFYTVLTSPSCVKVSVMQSANKRIHHKIAWRNAVPKIIRECYKKP